MTPSMGMTNQPQTQVTTSNSVKLVILSQCHQKVAIYCQHDLAGQLVQLDRVEECK